MNYRLEFVTFFARAVKTDDFPTFRDTILLPY